MKCMRLASAAAAIVLSAATASAQSASAMTDDKVQPQPITITGCVAAGTERNTFLLTNVVRASSAPTLDSPVTTPPTDAIYWLDSPEKLKGHAGHRVEVIGTLDDDIDKTTVKTDDGKVEVTTENSTKKVEVKEGTPAAVAAKAAVGASGKRVSYKIKVKSVKMIEGACS